MNRFGKKSLVFWGLGLAVAIAGGTAIVAGEDNGWHGKMSWTVVDEDGERHSKTIELDGTRPFLGVMLGRHDDGARVASVIEGSPAESAGLREGDVILGFDGREIETPWDLTHAVLETEPGTRVDLEVLRDGSRESISTEIGEHEGWVGGIDMKRFGHGWAFRHGRPRLGVELVDVTTELREHLGARDDEGVLVGRVIDDTPAVDAGVAVGDLIVAIDGESIKEVGDLQRLLAERDGETFGLEVIRDGRPVSLTVALPERDDAEVHPGRFPTWKRRHVETPGDHT